ncbi:MAG: NERD domain-containing protein [Gammaproteobacteria bacterium]|nr:NERD domain-containing protein [Gammaproteobacteria bacterium]NND59303.1 NERD domain-containing protein [Gammaproteobacteria bacterium]
MTPELTATFTIVAASAGLIAYISRSRSRARRLLRKTIRAISHDFIEKVVVPDGLDGKIQVDYLLLTTRGLLVLDVKDVGGVVFAGTSLERWAVIDGAQHYKISNPIGPSMARVIAIKRLVPDLPVHGRIVFTSDTEFHGDDLPNVVSLEQLRAEFLADDAAAADSSVDAFYGEWVKLRARAAAA